MNYKRILIEVGIFCSSVVGMYGLIWTFFEVSGFFHVDFPELRALGWIGHYLIILHGLLVALAIYVVYFLVRNGGSKPVGRSERNTQNDSTSKELNNQSSQSSDIDLMGKDLISAIEIAQHAERYEEVIRFGVALNRPLFVSGNHATRLKIGALVEDAAAVTGDETIQAEMLIDAIGWSLVELGNLDLGEKDIQHGLNLALKLSNEYLITRAYRHLGAIERRRNGPPLYGKAEEYFNAALEHASKVPIGLQRSESTAGCYYAIASLNYHNKNYEEAIKNLDKAIDDFEQYDHGIGVTRSMTKKADAYMALGLQDEAKDLLRKALQRAKKDTHRNQVVRASVGLAKIYVAENKYDKAVEHLVLAKELAKEMNVTTQLREIVDLEGKIPQGFREAIP